jgi:5-methylcytosine-specific restriction endonuclease McrA
MFEPHRRGKDGNVGYDEIDENPFDVVRSRDNHTCQICGCIIYKKDNIDSWPLPTDGREITLNNMVTVCDKCFFSNAYSEVQQEIRELSKWNHIEREISVAYGKVVLRDLKQKTRVFGHTGRFLFLRRSLIFLAGCLLTFFALSFLAGVASGLLISPQTGIRWFFSMLGLTYETAQTLAETPWLIILGIAAGYLSHTIERERYHFSVRIPYAKFHDVEVEEFPSKYGLSRPTWQYLGICSVLGLLGGLDWILISVGIINNLFGAGVFWTLGTAGSVYLVRPALHQDITEYGLRLRAGPWIATIRYGAILGGIGLLTASGMGGLLANMPADIQLVAGYASTLLPPSGDYIAVLLPGATGLAYVGRRYLELHSRRVSQVMHGLWQPKTVLETAQNESEPGVISTVKTIPSVLNRPWSLHSNPYFDNEFEAIDENEDENEQKADVSLDDVRTVFHEHDGRLLTSEVAERLDASFHAVADRMDELEERDEIIIYDEDMEDENSQSESHSHTEDTGSKHPGNRSPRSQDNSRPQADTSAGDDWDNSHEQPAEFDTVVGSSTDEVNTEYAQNKEAAFDRDDRICQLCGAEGYPKTDLGLVAVPAGDAGDYSVENLVTVCDTCTNETDPRKLRQYAATLKKWATTDDPNPPDAGATTIDADLDPDTDTDTRNSE